MALDPAPAQRRKIGRVAVLGAGVAGSHIAAHLANGGLSVLLLDRLAPGTSADAPHAARSRLAIEAIEALRVARPPAFYAPAIAGQITPGNFEDDPPQLRTCDWVLEAVEADLATRRSVLARTLPHLRPGTITTTNMGGLPATDMLPDLASGLESLDSDLRRHWFGTHFSHPPRSRRLVEMVATSETDLVDMTALADWLDRRLGSTVVLSRDIPNLIADRIGSFALRHALSLMTALGLSIEELDALTGSPIGWPRTGIVRMADDVGLQDVVQVAKRSAAVALSAQAGGAQPEPLLPRFVDQMFQNGWLGDKSGQGFYRRADGEADAREVLDWKTLEYKPISRARLPGLEVARTVQPLARRIAHLLTGGTAQTGADPADAVAAFYRPFLSGLFAFAAERVAADDTEPAASIVEIDRAMRHGCSWELGPFELFDAAGVRLATEMMQASGAAVPANVQKLLAYAAAHDDPEPTWYKMDTDAPSGRLFFDPFTETYKPVELPTAVLLLSAIKRSGGVIRGDAETSVIDLGDDIAAIELHSATGALGEDTVSFLSHALQPTSEFALNFNGFVIVSDSTNFSVGANLLQLLVPLQAGDWDEIDRMVRIFQAMTQCIKFSPRPVVIAPTGLCLGGGTEMALHAAGRQVHPELYMGLVEAAVGLIPGGGGSKEMTLRSLQTVPSGEARVGSGDAVDPGSLRRNFDAIAKATVSTSAAESRALGFLGPADRITPSRERLLADAKAYAQDLASAGYTAPISRTDIPAPGASVLSALEDAVRSLREGQRISEHDARVANFAAHVLCGGPVPPGTPVSEQYLLDLEREAFLSLCGEKKTQDRIAFTLKTGKPLRN